MAKKIKKYEGTKILEVLEGADNYNFWISEQILKHLKPPVLEFGSGIGNITQHTSSITPFVVSEVDPDLIARLKETFNKKRDVEIIEFDITKNPSTKLINKFNAVFSSNVLEHIEDDLNALKNLKKVLKKDGKIILLVPAKKIAYGRLDKQLGHHRRYEKKELVALLENSGFEVEKVYYFNILGLLAWKIRDRVTKNEGLKSSQIKLFDSIVPILKILESIIKPPVGISLIIIAKNSK